eukprot:6492169-Amphidinium_carterae.1
MGFPQHFQDRAKNSVKNRVLQGFMWQKPPQLGQTPKPPNFKKSHKSCLEKGDVKSHLVEGKTLEELTPKEMPCKSSACCSALFLLNKAPPSSLNMRGVVVTQNQGGGLTPQVLALHRPARKVTARKGIGPRWLKGLGPSWLAKMSSAVAS